MRFDTISPKQAEIFKFMAEPQDALICDGAVRSGKTIMMTIAFIEWAMAKFDGMSFGICGKTVRSAERNIIAPLMGIGSVRKKYAVKYSRSISLMTVTKGDRTNHFYVFGGKDESSYMLIQGITLAGVLFDEVALMPRTFVDQAIARTLSIDNAKLWFNCNPENPNHWFYKEWVSKPDEHNAKHLHFLMDDNPSLTAKALEKAKASFTGVFYDRYVRGLWVAAEGVIYRQFADNPERYIIDTPPQIAFANIGVDFGGNNSAHAFTCTGLLPNMRGVVTLDEYHSKEALDPAELENKFVSFVRRQLEHYNVVEIYADSAEQVLIRGFRNALARAGIGVPVRNAIKGAIVDRIRLFTSLIGADRYKVMRNCEKTVEALSGALWNAKKLNDERLDDGTTNIDSLDAMEYSVEKYQKQLMTAMLFRER